MRNCKDCVSVFVSLESPAKKHRLQSEQKEKKPLKRFATKSRRREKDTIKCSPIGQDEW